MYVYIYTHIYEYYSAIKKKKKAICSNMDETGDYETKWNKSEKERRKPYDITYRWNLTYNKNKHI